MKPQGPPPQYRPNPPPPEYSPPPYAPPSTLGDAGGSSPGLGAAFTTYLRTPKGTLLAAEAILCIVILICFGASWTTRYIATPLVELILVVIYFCIFMHHWDRTIPIHWPWSDLIRAVIGSVWLFITSIYALSYSDTAGVVGGVFALLAGALFAYDAYTTVMSMKRKHEQAHAALITADSPEEA